MSFKEIVAQDSAILFLKTAYRNNRVAHAYLFAGPEGVGKKKTALNFAKLLFCETPIEEESCDKCSSCVKIDALNHPDAQFVSPDGQFIKIDAIREASRRLSLKGFESSRKILFVFDAHCLNEESSNALLKTLEEPSGDTVILLISDIIKAILPTIVSRCQRVVFSALPKEEIRLILRSKSKVKDDECFYLSDICEGSLSKASQYLDSGLFAKKNKIIQDALDNRCSLDKFIQLSSLTKADKDVKIEEVLCVLSSWFRDLFFAKIFGDSKHFINIDSGEVILRHSEKFSLSDIEERISAIAQAQAGLKYNVNTRISLTNLRVGLWK